MKHGKKSTSATTGRAPAWRFLAFVPLSLLWLEVIFRLATVDGFFGGGLFFMFFFTLAAAALFILLCTLFKTKVNRVVAIVLLFLATALYVSQTIYHGIFSEYYILSAIGMAGDAVTGFSGSVFKSLWANALPILLELVPLVLFCVFGKRHIPVRRAPAPLKAALVVVMTVCHLIAMLTALAFKDGDDSPAKLYTQHFMPKESASTFGLLTTERLDLKYMIFGSTPDDDFDTPSSLPTDPEPEQPTEPEQVVYADNVIDSLDFEVLAENEEDKTIRNMHNYFASLTASKENEYTGKFEGKNLIFIVAEGFSPYAISEELTPTLYKLSHEGIQCTNYYTPGWGVSTSDGEYTSLLGLMPAMGVRSMKESADRNMYFSLGNMLKRQNYNTYAFHNHTYTYYDRDKSHPNLGYTYQGIGNGLELDYSSYYPGKNTKTRWPNSDYLMALATEGTYMDNQPFHTYYLTVSGHMLYTFTGNSMASYHKDKVDHLPYSDSVKAYLACQLELEYMVAELLETLTEKGIADDTVIVLTADHYPYGLQQEGEPDYYSELAGHDTTSTFEKYRNTLILWHEGLESIVIDEPTYSIDLLPTLSNLFGLDYDSRLMMGRDFLSDSTPLVCFSNRSWITDKGRYDSQTKTFTPNEGVTVDEDYVSTVSTIVSRKFTYSDLILKEDYYNLILGG